MRNKIFTKILMVAVAVAMLAFPAQANAAGNSEAQEVAIEENGAGAPKVGDKVHLKFNYTNSSSVMVNEKFGVEELDVDVTTAGGISFPMDGGMLSYIYDVAVDAQGMTVYYFEDTKMVQILFNNVSIPDDGITVNVTAYKACKVLVHLNGLHSSNNDDYTLNYYWYGMVDGDEIEGGTIIYGEPGIEKDERYDAFLAIVPIGTSFVVVDISDGKGHSLDDFDLIIKEERDSWGNKTIENQPMTDKFYTEYWEEADGKPTIVPSEGMMDIVAKFKTSENNSSTDNTGTTGNTGSVVVEGTVQSGDVIPAGEYYVKSRLDTGFRAFMGESGLLMTNSSNAEVGKLVFEKTSDGYYKIKSKNSNLYFTSDDKLTQQEGTGDHYKIIQAANNNSDYQKWVVEKDTDGYYLVKNVANDCYMDVKDACASDMNSINLFYRNDYYNAQDWQFELIAAAEVDENPSGVDVETSGLVASSDGTWTLVENGKIKSDFNDLYCDETWGWWLVTNGVVDFDYTGLYYSESYGWWLINAGQPAFDYNDLYGDANLGWWKITNGMVDFNYTGLFGSANYGWWLVYGGQVAFDYSDLWGDPNYGWWKITNGMVDFGYTGLFGSQYYGWWLIGGGQIAFDYTDLWGDANYGWWKIVNGTIDFDYNGVYSSPMFGDWNVAGGQVMFY